MKVLYSSATEFCEAPPGMELAVGRLGRGADALRQRAGQGPRPRDGAPAPGQELRTIVRIAGPLGPLARARRTTSGRSGPIALCREKIEARGLDMKLVSAHYLLDEQKILFFFTAENRVDFRELVKDLVAVFKMRIELRQIGVRDEARVVGGVGICGRALCCNADHRPAAARVHQDGQGAEPHAELDEDLGALRAAALLPLLRVRRVPGGPRSRCPPWARGCSSRGRSSG